MKLKEGTLLHGGNYQIVRHVSSGGFGNTYEGLDVVLNRRVAIKEFFVKDFCLRDADSTHVTVSVPSKKPLIEHLRKKFVDEARAIACMEHDNIVKVLTLFEENGTAYYVMDFIDGESVGDLLKRRGPLPESEALPIVLKVASALGYMHQQNRFHLDVKPGNIMLRRDGKVVLIDFGSSKQYAEVDGENTTTMAPCYTPGYAPSEQMNPKATKFTAATDLYALGATLYKMLTGVTPPSAIDLQNEDEVLPPLPSEISPSVKACVEKAMIPQRSKRTQSVAEFVALLRDEERTVVDPDAQQRAEEERRREEAAAQAAREKEKRELAAAQAAKEQAAREQAEAEARAKAAKADAERKAREEANRQQKASAQKSSNWEWLRPIGIVAALATVASIAVGIYFGYFWKEPSAMTAVSEAPADSIEAAPQEFVSRPFTVKDVTFDMMLVEAGTFTMGDNDEQQDPSDMEKPAHQVTLTDDYYIGRTEVTQALWEAVMGSNPSEHKGGNLPVENVSWDDCQAFITKLNAATGENFRLPTEAEWEFAARGGNNSNHTLYRGSSDLDAVAWYDDNSGSHTHPVASKGANELGIYDMSGNVWEWCQDCFDTYRSGSQTNPKGPSSAFFRIYRGGGFNDDSRKCRVTKRGAAVTSVTDNHLGLRLAL